MAVSSLILGYNKATSSFDYLLTHELTAQISITTSLKYLQCVRLRYGLGTMPEFTALICTPLHTYIYLSLYSPASVREGYMLSIFSYMNLAILSLSK